MSVKGSIITSHIGNEYLIQEAKGIDSNTFSICEDRKEDDEPITCARFGCGKILTLQERLFGKYCVEDSGKKPIDVMKVLKFK